jgi:sugar lactone lactonase YvrE
MIPVGVALPSKDEVGESPVWDDVRGELVRVNVFRGLVHRWNPTIGSTTAIRVNGEVSAVCLRDGGPDWLVAVGRELLVVGADGQTVIAQIDTESDDIRLNDCKCDPHGRLWAGTMSKSGKTGTAALFRFTPDGVMAPMLDGTTVSNGLGWSPDGRTMYFVDSPTQRIDAFDFEDGSISNRRVLTHIEEEAGVPDGLTVDADGGVWVALFGGGAVRCYAPDGTLRVHLRLPVTNPTGPTFGGSDLATLYVTSASVMLSPEQVMSQPAGAVLSCRPGVHGLQAARFGD